MNCTFRIKMRAALWTMIAVTCLASAPAMAAEPEWWTKQKRDCGLPSSLVYNNWDGQCKSSTGGSTSTPSYDYGAAQRAREAEAERQRQAEAERVERERLAEEKRQKDAKFIRDRDAAANTLKGSSSPAMNQLKGLSGTDSFGLKGSGFDTGSTGLKELRGSDSVSQKLKLSPHTDTSVVDARNVPSGLQKALDNAIATAYSSAPPGVSDRVRKGFQAVMERDWKVAKAWFQEALKRDPTNVGLKRLVALTDSSTHVDTRNEPAGLGGTPDARSAGKQTSQAQPVSVSKVDTNLQLPDPDDIRFLFPGLQKMKGEEAPVFTTLPDGRRVQMPQDSDMEYLFGPQAAPKATPTYIIGKNGQLVQVPENADQESQIYIKGKNGELMAVPQPKDNLFMFPGISPAATSNPAVESGKAK
jgi:hypothetical protein